MGVCLSASSRKSGHRSSPARSSMRTLSLQSGGCQARPLLTATLDFVEHDRIAMSCGGGFVAAALLGHGDARVLSARHRFGGALDQLSQQRGRVERRALVQVGDQMCRPQVHRRSANSVPTLAIRSHFTIRTSWWSVVTSQRVGLCTASAPVLSLFTRYCGFCLDARTVRPAAFSSSVIFSFDPPFDVLAVAFPFDFVALAELVVRHPMASRWVGADWADTCSPSMGGRPLTARRRRLRMPLSTVHLTL